MYKDIHIYIHTYIHIHIHIHIHLYIYTHPHSDLIERRARPCDRGPLVLPLPLADVFAGTVHVRARALPAGLARGRRCVEGGVVEQASACALAGGGIIPINVWRVSRQNIHRALVDQAASEGPAHAGAACVGGAYLRVCHARVCVHMVDQCVCACIDLVHVHVWINVHIHISMDKRTYTHIY